MTGTAAPASVRVPFGSLDADYRRRKSEIDAAVARVLSRGRFILGEEVETFERGDLYVDVVPVMSEVQE